MFRKKSDLTLLAIGRLTNWETISLSIRFDRVLLYGRDCQNSLFEAVGEGRQTLSFTLAVTIRWSLPTGFDLEKAWQSWTLFRHLLRYKTKSIWERKPLGDRCVQSLESGFWNTVSPALRLNCWEKSVKCWPFRLFVSWRENLPSILAFMSPPMNNMWWRGTFPTEWLNLS